MHVEHVVDLILRRDVQLQILLNGVIHATKLQIMSQEIATTDLG